MGRGTKLGKKWNNRSSATIFWDVTHPGTLYWLVVDPNNFCYVRMGHYKVSLKCRMNMWVKSEAFPTYTISSWVFTISYTLVPELFVGLYLPLFFFRPLIIIVGWIVYLHSIKFTSHIVREAPISILSIYGNLILLFIDSLVFNIVK